MPKVWLTGSQGQVCQTFTYVHDLASGALGDEQHSERHCFFFARMLMAFD